METSVNIVISSLFCPSSQVFWSHLKQFLRIFCSAQEQYRLLNSMQKFRMQRRQILPKEDEKRWPRPQPRDSVQRSYYPHKPIMAFPTYQSNHAPATGQFYPPWVAPGSYPNGAHMWGSPYYPGWRPSETWHRTPHPGVIFPSLTKLFLFS